MLNLTSLFLDDVFLTIYNLIIMIYDLNERRVDGEKLLKKSLSNISKSFIEKSLKSINDFIIKSNIIMKVKDLYKNDEIFQRIINAKKIE